ncbi:hypothetical protein Tco_1440432 [Tanacetum coccineum]
MAITTTTAFEVSHEDAYDSDVDEAPHAAPAFMANLMQTGPSTGQGTDFDVDSVIDDHDNTIPYHQYQLNNEVESVPTNVSYVVPGGISVITILDDLRSQLTGHIKTNKEQSFANDSLKAELERYKTQVQNLEQNKNALEESYLEELVWLRNTNKVVMELLQSYGQPVQTVPMLSKRPTFSTKDLHKSALGHRNPLYLKSAQLCRPTLYLGDVIVDPVHTPLRVYDSEETLVQAEVSRTKMLERMKDPLCKVSSKPINYAKLNSLYDTFVPQKQLSSEQVYWLPANEVASYNWKRSGSYRHNIGKHEEVRIKNDSLRDENISIKKHYQDLYQSKAESNSNVSSRATVPERPKVLAPGLYAMTSKYSSNDMVHNHYLEEAKKQTHEIGRNSKTSVIPSARSQSIANGSKPKPRINNQKSRNWHASKTKYQLADIFTKVLCRERIEFLINKPRMRSFTPETLKQLADEAEE